MCVCVFVYIYAPAARGSSSDQSPVLEDNRKRRVSAAPICICAYVCVSLYMYPSSD